MLSLGLSLGLQDSGSDAALWLEFLGSETLDPRITFSRGSNATLTDSTGKITYAPANLLTYSQDTSNAAWTALNGSKGSSSVVGPDGLNNLGLFTATSAGNRLQQVPSLPANTTYVLSAYMSPGTASYGGLVAAGVASAGAIFNLSGNGSVVSTVGSGVSAVITKVGSLYRASLIFTTSSAGSSNLGAGVSDGSTYNFTIYPSATSGNINVGFFQLEPVTYQTTPSAYQATTSTAYYGPRFDYDPVTLAAKGLLIEEQRTNQLLRSEEFNNAAWTKSGATITENAINSPNGTVNADTLVEDTSNGSHQGAQGVNFASGVAYTFSVYAKYLSANRFLQLIFSGAAFSSTARAVFDLSTGASAVNAGTASATSIGNGWWRCSFTVSATSTTSSNINIALANTNAATFIATQYTGDGTSGIYIWGAQLEAGAFATSYIPTVASTVTRSADVATMTGANFSSWYNQAAGTFVTVADTNAPAASAPFVFSASANDGTNENRISVFPETTNWRYYVNSSNVGQAAINVAGFTVGTVAKLAAAYAVNSFNMAVNGTAGTEDTSGVAPTVNALFLGRAATNTLYLNGHIRTLAYYNTRLPNAQLQSLTA